MAQIPLPLKRGFPGSSIPGLTLLLSMPGENQASLAACVMLELRRPMSRTGPLLQRNELAAQGYLEAPSSSAGVMTWMASFPASGLDERKHNEREAFLSRHRQPPRFADVFGIQCFSRINFSKLNFFIS